MQQEKWSNISVIIINWNGEQFLDRCLSSLTNQSVRPYEIIVVDNASSDKSIEIVCRFSFVRLIALDHNTGFARGNNLAIKASSAASEWIALINPDACADPRWLEELIAAAKCNPEFDVFASKLLNAKNPSLMDGTGDAYHVSGRVRRLGIGTQALKAIDRKCKVFSPCAAAALYRRSAILEANGFDEDYFCYVEDVDLVFRLRLLGHCCLYVPESVVHHIGSAITGDGSDFSIYHGHRNLVWTYFKNMPGVFFWLFLPLHILLNIFTIIWFGLRGKFSVIMRSKIDAFRGIPCMWKKRRAIQKKRKASLMDIWRALDKSILPRFTTKIRQRFS